MADVSRREFLRQAGAGAAAAAALSHLPACRRLQAGKAARARRPRIIFILADDLGYGDVGCYGQQRIRTPHLNRIAAEGLRFTQAYAGSTVCAPSRCCLMTGHHTGHARVRGNQRHPLRPEDLTVAEVLRNAGYATGIFGKWGLGEPDTTGVPNRQGFDEWFGYLNQAHAHNYYPDYLWDNETKVALDGKTYSHDLFTTRALDFVTRHAKEPFFLYLAYTIPHANNELGRETGDGMEAPSDAPYSNENWPKQQKSHAAMITRMDADIGRLMALLQEIGIDDDTIVLFSSDNGPHREGGNDPDFNDSNGPLRGIKRDLYEGGIRVPTLARWPGRIEAGRTSDHPWAFWDFLPTAAELAGARTPEGLDGLSVAPVLLGGMAPRHEYLYWEFHEGGYKRAVRMDDWKGVKLAPDQPMQLYDLGKDLGETNDLAEEHPDVVAILEGMMAEAHVDSEHYPIQLKPKEGKAKTDGDLEAGETALA